MIDVCADYDATTTKVCTDVGSTLQNFEDITLEQCRLKCTEHQECLSLSYFSPRQGQVSMLKGCVLKTKKHEQCSQFVYDNSCTTQNKICTN